MASVDETCRRGLRISLGEGTMSDYTHVKEYAMRGDLFNVAACFPNRQLPEDTVVNKILKPISKAIAFLHASGIIHRDLKPENVVVMFDGTSKLCDFGLAIDTRCDVPVSRVGTLEYMAPELVRLDGDLNERHLRVLRQRRQAQYCAKVDVWALGCLAFESLFGHSPFMPYKKAPPEDIEQAILAGTPTSGGKCPPAISTDAMVFLRAALTQDAARRPSAAELLDTAWLQQNAPAAEASASPSSPPTEEAGVNAAPPETPSSPAVSAEGDQTAEWRSGIPERPPIDDDSARDESAGDDASTGRWGSAASGISADDSAADSSVADDLVAEEAGGVRAGSMAAGKALDSAAGAETSWPVAPATGHLRRMNFDCVATAAGAAVASPAGAGDPSCEKIGFGRRLRASLSHCALAGYRRLRGRSTTSGFYAAESRLLLNERVPSGSIAAACPDYKF